MNKRQQVRLEMFRRVEAFLVEHQSRVPRLASAASRTEFTRVLDRLEQHAIQQTSARARAMSGTKEKEVARESLRLHAMAPIIEVATSRVVALPDIGAIDLPSMRERDSVLLGVAESLADLAEPHREILDALLYSGSVDILREAIGAFRSAIAERDGDRAHEAMSTAAVASDIDAATRLVSILRRLMHREVGARSPLSVGFELASRVAVVPTKRSATVVLRPAISATARVAEAETIAPATPRLLSAPVLNAAPVGFLRRMLAKVPLRLSA